MESKIKKLRICAGYTQEMAAKALGISLPTLSRWERGLTEPKLCYAEKLADLYNCSIYDLKEQEEN